MIVHIEPDHDDVYAYVNDEDTKNQFFVTIGRDSYVSQALLEAGSTRASVLVGRYTSIAHRVVFEIGLNHNHHSVTTYPFRDMDRHDDDINHFYENNHYQIIIGNDVWIGEGVKVIGGVHIGNGAVIGMGTVVTKDVPPYSVVVGNPARVVKYRFDRDVIRRLESIKWWRWNHEDVLAARLDMEDPVRFVEKYYKEIKVPENDFTKTMDEVKAAGGRMYYFVLDLDSPRPLWDKVLISFIDAFSYYKNITLFIEMPESIEAIDEFDNPIRKLEKICSSCPGIVTLSQNQENNSAIFSHSSIYIASSSLSSISYVDQAEVLEIEVRSACDWQSGLFDV